MRRRQKPKRKNGKVQRASSDRNITFNGGVEFDGPKPSPRTKSNTAVILGNLSPRKLFGRKKSYPELVLNKHSKRVSSDRREELEKNGKTEEIRSNSTLLSRLSRKKKDTKGSIAYVSSCSGDETEEVTSETHSYSQDGFSWRESTAAHRNVPTTKKLNIGFHDMGIFDSTESTETPEWVMFINTDICPPSPSKLTKEEKSKDIKNKIVRKEKKKKKKKSPRKHGSSVETCDVANLRAKLLSPSMEIDPRTESKSSIAFSQKENKFFERYGLTQDKMNDLLVITCMDHMFPSRHLPLVGLSEGRTDCIIEKRIFQNSVFINTIARCKVISDRLFATTVMNSFLFGDYKSVLLAENCVLVGDHCDYTAINCIIIGKSVVIRPKSKGNRNWKGSFIGIGQINSSSESKIKT